MIQKLKVGQLILDAGTRHRAENDADSVVSEYAELMRHGVKFPPLIVYKDCDHGYFFLVDGFYRREAYLRNWEPLPHAEPSIPEELEIECDVRDGSLKDAQEFSFAVDAKNARSLSSKDKRFIVTRMLRDSNWNIWSDGKIADHIGWSQAFVSNIRRELTQNGFESPTKRLGKDGKFRRAQRHNRKYDEGHKPRITPWLAGKMAERQADLDMKATEYMDTFVDYVTDRCDAYEALERVNQALIRMKDVRGRLVDIAYREIMEADDLALLAKVAKREANDDYNEYAEMERKPPRARSVTEEKEGVVDSFTPDPIVHNATESSAPAMNPSS